MTSRIDLQSNQEKGLLAPSILSATFSKLGDEIQEAEKGGADWLHVDVMDGHFVPNITIGPMVVEAIRPLTKLPLDCHLMVSQPENWIDAFAEAGADVITIHAEVTKDASGLLKKIKDKGCLAGISINPATPLSAIESVLDTADLVLVMSVNPGFGGQKFIETSYEKITELKRLRAGRKFIIEVDGGVNVKNIGALRDAGCDVLVAGSAVFKSDDRASAISALKNAMENS